MAAFEVLLASDFTARSDRATERAIRLAQIKQGTLTIAHVVEKDEDHSKEELVSRLRADLPDNAKDAELIIRSGSAPKTLAAIAVERASDLIVTGVARYNSIGDYFLGTAVNHIIRNAEQPVLVVRRRAVENYQRIVVATDLSDCSRAALLAAAEIFPDASITVVHAFHVPYEGWLKTDEVKVDVEAEAKEQLEAFVATINADVRARLEIKLAEGELGTVIVDALKQTKADLLVLGTHGRSGFAHATIGSHAEALLSLVHTDVLMVREHK